MLVHPGIVKNVLLLCILLPFCTGNVLDSFLFQRNDNNEISLFEITSKKANNSSKCTDDCNGHGTCSSGKCDCYLFYSGSSCQTRWRSDREWFLFWNLLTALVILMFSILSILYMYYFCKNYLKLRNQDWRDWPISIYVMLIGFIATFGMFKKYILSEQKLCTNFLTFAVRVVCYAVDPISERGIIPLIATGILINITIILGQCCVFMLFLYWLELGQGKSARMPQNLEKFKPFLTVLVGITAVVCFPILIAGCVLNNIFLLGLYNMVMALDCLIVFIMIVAAGIRLLLKLQSIQNFSKKHSQVSPNGEEDVITIFIHKIRYYLLFMGLSLITFAVILPLYALSDALHDRWLYIRYQLILRVCEFVYGLTVLLLLVRRKRPFGGSRSASSSRKSENISVSVAVSGGFSSSNLSQTA